MNRQVISLLVSLLYSIHYISNKILKTSCCFTLFEVVDLDSILSAVVFAYISTYFPRKENQGSTLPNHVPVATPFYIPISNLPRPSLALRPELIPILHYAALTPNDLLTLSDLPRPLPPPKQTRLILVDHNALTGELDRVYGERVVGCIDHHEEEGRVPFGEINYEGIKGEPRIVDVRAGSCASLVTEWSRERWFDEILLGTTATTAHNNSLLLANAQLARVALAPILIDTACLKSSKTSPIDIDAALSLEQLIKQYDKAEFSNVATTQAYDRLEYFKLIQTAKQNLDDLSLSDILDKDYKQWEIIKRPELTAESTSTIRSPSAPAYLGISAVVKPISYLIQKSNSTGSFLDTCLSFACGRNLSLLAIMTSYQNDQEEFQRELFVWGLDRRGFQAAQWFIKEAGNQLNLTKCSVERYPGLDSPSPHLKTTVTALESEIPEVHPRLLTDIDIQWRRCFRQQNTAHSRKQVASFLRAAFIQTG